MDPLVLPALARRENALTLRSLIPELALDTAEERFERSISIDYADDSAKGLAKDIALLLGRTFTQVGTNNAASAELRIHVGDVPFLVQQPTQIYVSVSETQAHITNNPIPEAQAAHLPGASQLVVACYVAATATARLLPSLPHQPRLPMCIDLIALGLTKHDLCGPIVIRHTTLAGVGAIGCAFLYALATFDVSGEIGLADHDLVSDGNLQRQILFQAEDIGKSKVHQAIARLSHRVPKLRLFNAGGRIAEVDNLRTVVVAMDSPRSRRSLQEQLPYEVFDASTTGVAEVITFHTVLQTDKPCLGCVYCASEAEVRWIQHVAEHLGVSETDVDAGTVSDEAASKIAARHNVPAGGLIGQSYDTLFKALCGSVPVSSQTGNRAVAPFAFVSVLAGALLAIRLHRHLSGGPKQASYWNVSPWAPPRVQLQRDWHQLPNCTICSRPAYQRVVAQISGALEPSQF